MNGQQRGRSPSVGNRNRIRHTPSPSPHRTYQQNISGLGLDQSLVDDSSRFNGTFNNQPNQSNQAPFGINSQYLGASQPQQYPQQANAIDQTFFQPQSVQPHGSPSPHFGPQGNLFQPNLLDLGNTSGSNGAFDSQFLTSNSFNQDQSINNSSYLDPHLLDLQPQPNHAIDPGDVMNTMTSAQMHSPTPPHMLQPGMRHVSGGSPHISPALHQAAFTSPNHSRHTSLSLDPSSAAYPQGQPAQWDNSFRQHQRAPSDTYSDVSSSAHPSPYMGNNDTFDFNDNPSPLLGAQQDPQLFPNLDTFNQFSLSETHPRRSPGQSPHISPRLMPQPTPPAFTNSSDFGLSRTMNPPFGTQAGGLDLFPGSGQEAFPQLTQHNGSIDRGQADQMSPPEISIDFAPPSRQPSFEPPKEPARENALSPPERSRSRMRAKSDPFIPSRPSTPGSDPSNTLSPNTAKHTSRSPSPSSKGSRRSSTSSIPHRDYILDLAASRPAPNATGDPSASPNRRSQKHPATFQCTLCPKRFTRAYNLRSHLRTHTDERPFVCSVCGKAFARQHDRKRHEGLHSGEKKFVCRGQLKDGSSWGCGRRFARADALGRHFRSEAGRVCIRPLLDEEARDKGWDQQQLQQQQQQQQQAGMDTDMLGAGQTAQPQQGGLGMQMSQPPQQPGFGAPFQQSSASYAATAAAAGPVYGLPAALLAQYPALAGLQWDALGGDEGDDGGRSSFDASSGGEMWDEDEDFGAGGQAFGYASDQGY